jgi:hypothetical protein
MTTCVQRERFLGQHAVLPQPGQRDGGLRVAHVELAQVAAGGVVHVGQDRLVEVDATEALDALRRTQDLQAPGLLAHDGGVEGATTQVVDRDDLAVVQPAGRRVVGGGRRGLRHHQRRLDPGGQRHLVEQLAAERSPVGRMGEHDPVRGAPFGADHLLHDVAQQRAEQGGDGVGHAAQHQRRRVAQIAFDLPADQVRMAHRAPVGRVPGDDGAVLARVDDRRHHHRAVAEREHLDPGRPRDRGRHERRSEINPETVCHVRVPPSERRSD